MTDVQLDAVRRGLLKTIEDTPGMSINRAAIQGGVSPSTLYASLRYGTTKSNTLGTLEKVAKGMSKSLSELEMIGLDKAPKKLRVTGVISTGARVLTLGNSANGGGMREVEPPVGLADPEGYEGLVVEDDAMRPMLLDGWLVVFPTGQDGIAEECVGKLCVVELEDGSRTIRILRRASEPNRYNLESAVADTIYDAKVRWAARVRSIHPS